MHTLHVYLLDAVEPSVRRPFPSDHQTAAYAHEEKKVGNDPQTQKDADVATTTVSLRLQVRNEEGMHTQPYVRCH